MKKFTAALALLLLAIGTVSAQPTHHVLPANSDTVHWGYFSKGLEPRLTISSGDFVTIETLTHHTNDDASLMVNGDPGAESVFRWTNDAKGVDRRGAGPVDASLFGRGAGEGLGVHILTGPIAIEGAMRDAFRKMRAFLMNAKGLSEDEAVTLMSVAVDFGVTQVVDGNWGVHGIVNKAIFP